MAAATASSGGERADRAAGIGCDGGGPGDRTRRLQFGAFTGIAAHCCRNVFPVTDFGGTLAGLVSPDTLARVPPAGRTEVTLGQVAAAVPPAYLAAPAGPRAAVVTPPHPAAPTAMLPW